MDQDRFFYQDSKRPHIPKAIPAEIFKALWRGLKTCHIVRIDYSDSEGQASCRKVLPEVIFRWSDLWYLAGYCYFRQQERLFRIDRISKAQLSGAKGRSRGIAEKYQERKLPPWEQTINVHDQHDNIHRKTDDGAQSAPIDSPGSASQDLINACFLNSQDKLLKAIDAGADVNIPGRLRRSTPLHLAAGVAGLNVVKTLVKHGADVLAVNYDGQTILHAAAQGADLAVVRFLLKPCRDLINTRDYYGRTALHYAVRENSLAVVKALVAAGADLELRPAGGESLIMTAIKYNSEAAEDIIPMLEYFIKQKLLVNIKDASNCTALFHAVEHSNLPAVQLLLRNHAIPHFYNQNGRSPLLQAVLQQEDDIAKLLLEHGAPPDDAEEDSGLAPILVKSISPELCECLLKYGANPDLVDKQGRCALRIHFSRPEILRVLLEYGANTRLRSSNGNTLLHDAVLSKHPCETWQVLAPKVSWSTSANNDGVTPQMLAVQHGLLPLLPDILATPHVLKQRDQANRCLLDYAGDALSCCGERAVREQIRQLIRDAMAQDNQD
ncbi:MAG: ankyrin repeat domain-containing protein [Lentisphaeria bacterium]